ncbi:MULTISPECIES: glycosyltransferase family 2 protein [Aeromonas]|uniref:glycosyltransferase family 2 protein n=1 Tax=Aeromonas TaxID=642 RepID=UPI00149563F0|nr:MULTISPECIES: glycosyltransferase family 2 protein [Aeromonas]MBA8783665.1 glycosyltransferase family 2 protein [Aeromonas caviae]MBA8787719.1 glycosyltransferase family 2 protein [Aeromonas sp. TW 6]
MISIASIFKNEKPFIIEWLAYHMVLGIQDFYIADNISSDGGSELLHFLDKAKLIKRVDYPTQDGVPPQLGAYSKILSMLGKDKWAAFIDADEFISPSNYEDGLNKLTSLLNDQTIGAISLNWAVYGSSHSILPDDGLVIERFVKRAADLHPVNRHYKSIVRVSDFIETGSTPHAFIIKSDKKFVMPNGAQQHNHDGISDVIDWSVIRLNHYVIKSKSEFLNKKAARGRATTLKDSLGRNLQFFKNHDLNDVEQHIPSWFLRKVKCQIKTINERLLDNGYQPSIEKSNEPLYQTTQMMGVGFVDTINKNSHAIVIRGWAVGNGKKPCSSIAMVINNTILICPDSISFHDRPDVKQAGIGDGIGCGFTVSITLPRVSISSVDFYALNTAGLAVVELKANTQTLDVLVSK